MRIEGNETQEWTMFSTESIFFKFGRGVDKRIFRLPNGQEKDFYIQTSQKIVSIIPVTTRNEVILNRRFAPGPKKIIVDTLGGYIDKGETPEQAAERELMEESSFKGHLKLLVEKHKEPYSEMYHFGFIATDCVQTTQPQFDPTEGSQLIFFTFEEFKEFTQKIKSDAIDVATCERAVRYLGI